MKVSKRFCLEGAHRLYFEKVQLHDTETSYGELSRAVGR